MTGAQSLTESQIVEEFLCTRTDEAFGALFHAFYPQLRRYFSVRGCATDLAEELAQDVLVAVYRKSEALRDPASFRAWLFTIAHNAIRQHLRRNQNAPLLQPLDGATGRSGGKAQEHEGFLDMIGVLGDQERRLMMLRYIEQLSYGEIAETMGLPMGTVKWKLFDCKSRICAALNRKSSREDAV